MDVTDEVSNFELDENLPKHNLYLVGEIRKDLEANYQSQRDYWQQNLLQTWK